MSKEKVKKPLPPGYVCGACGLKDDHAIYNCPNKISKKKKESADGKDTTAKAANATTVKASASATATAIATAPEIPTTSVYVSGLPFKMTKDEVLEFLESKGCLEGLLDVHLVPFADNEKKHKGVAFLSYKKDDSKSKASIDACLALQGQILDEAKGKELRVELNTRVQPPKASAAHAMPASKISKKRTSGPRCYRCGEAHDPSECQNQRVCYKCKSTEHLSKNCPKKQKKEQ